MQLKLQYGLITYTQCDGLDPWRIVDLFAKINAECIIGREYHSDGGLHFHCFVEFGRIFRSRDPRVFDIEGWHPNIQHVGRTPWVAYDYSIKEGDVVAGGAERPREPRDRVSRADEIWSTIMEAKTRDEFFRLCKQLAPAKLATSFNSITAYADSTYQMVPDKYRHPEAITFLPSRVGELDAWAKANLGLRTGGT